MGETEMLTEYIARAKYEDLEVAAVDHAKEPLADTIVCGLGGRKTLDRNIVIEIMKHTGGRLERR